MSNINVSITQNDFGNFGKSSITENCQMIENKLPWFDIFPPGKSMFKGKQKNVFFDCRVNDKTAKRQFHL